MSRNGSGTYNLPAGNPVVTGTTISSTWANNTLSDMATALTQSIAYDGQTTPVANLPMGGYNHTNVANATARTQYASAGQVEDGTLNYLTSVSGTNAITATAPVSLSAYVAGQTFRFIAAGANTGAVTLNLNAIGAKAVTRDGTTALVANDIVSGGVYQVVYDGTQFQLTNSSNASVQVTSFSAGTTGLTPSTATTGAITLAGTLNVANGGTGLTSLTAGYIPFGAGTGAYGSSANLFWDSANARLGIGTGTPLKQFQVKSPNTTSESIAIIGNGNTQYGFEFKTDGNLLWSLNVSGSRNLGFQTNDVERMRIDSSGNVGLGVTPSAWGASAKVLELPNGTFLLNYSSSSQAILGANAYYTGSNWIYKNTAASSNYEQNSGVHKWFTAPSGTAGTAITFTQAMTLDNSGNLGIGTASPDAGSRLTLDRTTNNNLLIRASGVDKLALYADASISAIDAKANPLSFYAGSSERMRIDSSGNLLVGTASRGKSNSNSFDVDVSDGILYQNHISGTASGSKYSLFSYNGTEIGSITQNGTTGVLYNITSDQRLKENIVDAPSALAKIDSVKVRSFDFKSDGSHVEFGTIAQELYEVAPECVAKGDDGEEIEHTWGVDTSVLVPAMIKAIQELSAKVTALEAQLGVK